MWSFRDEISCYFHFMKKVFEIIDIGYLDVVKTKGRVDYDNSSSLKSLSRAIVNQ